MDTVSYALERIGVERPTWQTLVVSAAQEIELPAAQLWNTWTRLESWPEWSRPLHEATRWTGQPGWVAGATFEQILQLGFPVGRSVNPVTVGAVDPGRLVSWWHTEGSMRTCHVWSFAELSSSRTRVTDTEVFHGLSVGLLKPLLLGNWQRRFAASVAGLARAASQPEDTPA